MLRNVSDNHLQGGIAENNLPLNRMAIQAGEVAHAYRDLKGLDPPAPAQVGPAFGRKEGWEKYSLANDAWRVKNTKWRIGVESGAHKIENMVRSELKEDGYKIEQNRWYNLEGYKPVIGGKPIRAVIPIDLFQDIIDPNVLLQETPQK